MRWPITTGEIEPVLLPRDAFFGPREDVPVQEAIGRVAAEQITPYPPGIPALVRGERITAGIIDYLRSGLAAGMVLPDPADPSLTTSASVRAVNGPKTTDITDPIQVSSVCRHLVELAEQIEGRTTTTTRDDESGAPMTAAVRHPPCRRDRSSDHK